MTKEELQAIIDNLEHWLLSEIRYGSTNEEDTLIRVHEKLKELKNDKGAY